MINNKIVVFVLDVLHFSRQQFPSKFPYLFTKKRGVVSQKARLIINTSVRTSNLALILFFAVFAFLREEPFRFFIAFSQSVCLSVFPCVCIYQCSFYWRHFHEIWLWRVLWKSVGGGGGHTTSVKIGQNLWALVDVLSSQEPSLWVERYQTVRVAVGVKTLREPNTMLRYTYIAFFFS